MTPADSAALAQHAVEIRRVLLDAETSTDPLDALLAEIEELTEIAKTLGWDGHTRLPRV